MGQNRSLSPIYAFPRWHEGWAKQTEKQHDDPKCGTGDSRSWVILANAQAESH
ncbi:unnamed protein product [marine sediment metagenome]|uniref:Uncharacterized protein n=1 Tax=marine sediment metagenome TaxID=412755 RepID=X0ZRV5_9ZZZZ